MITLRPSATWEFAPNCKPTAFVVKVRPTSALPRQAAGVVAAIPGILRRQNGVDT
jgi:hypothetical protein